MATYVSASSQGQRTHSARTNKQIEDILEKAKNDNKKEVENILESQAMIDEIIVNNSDDILMIKKAKEENSIAIRQLERQIDKVDKEIEMTKKAVQSKTDIIQRGFQSNNPDSSMDCKLCEKSFNKFVDLENHNVPWETQHIKMWSMW